MPNKSNQVTVEETEDKKYTDKKDFWSNKKVFEKCDESKTVSVEESFLIKWKLLKF